MKRSAQQNRKQHRVKREGRLTLKNLLQFLVMVPVLVLLVGSVSTKAYAASGINKQINFQGKLVDNNGLNVADSTYTVVFSLYTVSSGGSAAWTESDSVTTSNGVFQVALGAVTALPGNVDFNSDTWYLGIKVGSDLEMTPRVRFSAVPYAFNAAALDGVVATNSASQFTITGGTNALIDLTVNGSLTLGSTIKPTAVGGLTVQSNGANGLTLDTGSPSTITLGATATTLNIGTSNTATAITLGSGTGGNTISIGNGTVANGNSQNITIGTSSTGTGLDAISIGSTNGNSSVAINVSNNNGLNIDAPTGAFIQIQSTGGSSAYRLITNLNLGTVQNDFAISDSNGNSKIYFAGSSNNAGFVKDAVGVGPGFVTPRAALDVEGGNTSGNAALILNQLGASTNDILSASAAGATKFTISNGGTVTIAAGQSYTGSGAVTLSSGGSSGLTIDSASGRVSVATGDFLNTGLAGVSGATSGDIWYDTTAQKFKINENGTTKILCNLTDTGCGTGGAVTLQAAYNGGQTIDLSTTGTGLTVGTNAGNQNIVFAPNAGGQAALVINDQGTGAILTASASGATKLVLSHTGNIGIGSSNPQQALTIGSSGNVVTEMAAPSGATASLTNTGSNALPNGNYFYKITASDGSGETLGSTETSVCTSASNQHTCAVSWSTVTGAVSYKIYRTSTSGSYTGTNFLTSVTTTSYTDDGSVSLTSGTPPSATTAYINKVTASGNSWLLGGKVGIGTATPLARLHVAGGDTGGNAAEIIDQVGAATNDILTGSASGATKLRVANTGQIDVVGGLGSDFDTIGTATLTIGGSTQNGLTLGRSGATTIINGSGLTIGATSWTATPTISGLITATSGVSVASGQSYTGAGAVTLSSGAGTTLTIDSGTTGALNIGTGANGKTITIGNTTANTALAFTTGGTGSITLGGNNGVGNVLIQPNAGGQAALIIKDQGSGDLLAASAGATTKFIVHNDGSIQTIGANATADITTITGGNGLTILPKTNASGAGGGLTLKAGNGTGAAGGGLVLDAGTGSTNGTISIGTSNQSGLTLGRSGATTTINGSSLTFGGATGVSGAVTITSNSTAALTVGANGSINPVLTVNASTGSVATGLQVLGAATGGTTALSVTDSGSNANLSIDAKGSGTITIGGTSTGNIIIGGASNGLTFSTTAGPSYTGSGRPIKQLILSAEYPGAVLTASASAAIAGNMTSDASPSAITNIPGAIPNTFSYENYYQWVATTTTDQQYTIAVRVTLPKDFSAWVSGTTPYALTVNFNTAFTTASLDHLDVYIYQYGDTSSKPIAFKTNQVSGTSKNWTQVQIPSTDLTGGTATWDSTHRSAVVLLTMHSANTVNYVQVGDITLNYLAAF